ncbi:hypothetical protein Z043_122276, partial [Scleropages formosus]
MLVLGIVAAEETNKTRPLLALCVRTLMDTASSPLPEDWDQTLDLPQVCDNGFGCAFCPFCQVCAVHTLQALVRGSALGMAMLQYAAAVTILSLKLLSSPYWAMRNAALQLYTSVLYVTQFLLPFLGSLCSRLLGPCLGGDDGSTHHRMSPCAFFSHYPTLQPFLLKELRSAASELQGHLGDARLRLHPSLFPVLTLLAKLQSGVSEETHDDQQVLRQVVAHIETRQWLATPAQLCPLVRSAYLEVVMLATRFCSHSFLHSLQTELLLQLQSHTQEPLASLKAALLDGSVEYRKMYLAALLAVMTPSDADLHFPYAPPQQPSSGEHAELLLVVLESGMWGPELLSQALQVLSLLLPLRAESLLIDRWCRLLEIHKVPEAPTVLRLACAQALRLAGVLLLSPPPKGRNADSALSVRLIGTGIYLLKDDNLQVRTEVAGFTSALARARTGSTGGHCFLTQVNRCLLFLLDLLLEEFWDSPYTLEILLHHLPEADLDPVLRDAQCTEPSCLYEKDEANVFSEPAAMSEYMLPFLLKLVEKVPESAQLGDLVARWARENTEPILENIAICKAFNP